MDPVLRALADALRVVVEGYDTEDPSSGLLGLLGEIDAVAASQPRRSGQPTIAAHAAHIHFGLHATVRELAGQPALNWEASWQPAVVDEVMWEDMREALKIPYLALRQQIALGPADKRFVSVATTWGIAHAAYHFGAIRQLWLEESAGS